MTYHPTKSFTEVSYDSEQRPLCGDCAAGNHESHEASTEDLEWYRSHGQKISKDFYDCKNLFIDGTTKAITGQCCCRATMPFDAYCFQCWMELGNMEAVEQHKAQQHSVEVF